MEQRRSLPLWLIPMVYTAATIAAAVILPRLESGMRSADPIETVQIVVSAVSP